MTGYAAIDLSQLPVPDAIEALDTEAMIAQIKAAVQTAAPELAAVLALESEPAVKLIEAYAYFGLLHRARVNDGVRAVLLATASGADLEHLAALFGVRRLVIIAADPDADPPIAEVLESDSDLRARAQLALEGFSTAGPRGAYLFHALSASGDVLDVSVASPAPGDVLVTVLSRSGDGTASSELISTVAAALNDEDVRPLCDTVIVQGATLVGYEIAATITVLDGPDASTVIAAAQSAVAAYATARHRLGRAVRLSGIYAALHQPGVELVTLIQPAGDILCDPDTAPVCTAISVTVAP